MSGPRRKAPNMEGASAKKAVYILIGAILLFLVVAGVLYFTVINKPRSVSVAELVGSWEDFNENGGTSYVGKTTIDFKADGTYTMNLGDQPGGGTYKVEGDTVICDPGDPLESRMKIVGGTLVQTSYGVTCKYRKVGSAPAQEASPSTNSMDPVAMKARYDQLQTGMTYNDVVRIMGEEPSRKDDKASDGTQSFVWQTFDGKNVVTVTFKDGKLSGRTRTYPL